MNLEEKLKKQQYKEIWQQYCGFLDLSMDGYMKIQRRLMEEQIRLWSNCGLGQSILKGKHPTNLDEFRKMVPLTTYEDTVSFVQNDLETIIGMQNDFFCPIDIFFTVRHNL